MPAPPLLFTTLPNICKDMSDEQAEITRLRAEITDLRATNSSLNRTIKILSNEASGIHFAKFNELPSEIRSMIWTIATRTPQIHIIEDRRCSRSRINMVMESCREARDQCLALELPYFVISQKQNVIESHECISESCTKLRLTTHKYILKSYMNHEDTVWVVDGKCEYRDAVAFFCSHCNQGTCIPCANCCTFRLGRLILEDTTSLRCELARPLGLSSMKLMPALLKLDVENLYLFDNPPCPQARPRDAVLVKLERDAWSRSMTRKFEAFKQRQIVYSNERIQRVEARKLIENQPQLSKILRTEMANLDLLSRWKVPSVQYVEIQSATLQKESKDWITTPMDS